MQVSSSVRCSSMVDARVISKIAMIALKFMMMMDIKNAIHVRLIWLLMHWGSF